MSALVMNGRLSLRLRNSYYLVILASSVLSPIIDCGPKGCFLDSVPHYVHQQLEDADMDAPIALAIVMAPEH